jgi:hypothetical protein
MVFDLMPAACSSIPPLDGSQQASHRTPLGGIVSTAEPLIRPPVHAFRFVGEPFRHDRAPSWPHSNFLCLIDVAKVQGFTLACIRQVIAVPAREQFSRAVQHGNAASTVRDGTDEPSGRFARPGNGGLWRWQRRSRWFEYCVSRCRHVTADAADDTAACLKLISSNQRPTTPKCCGSVG